jgi:hypothetical protein
VRRALCPPNRRGARSVVGAIGLRRSTVRLPLTNKGALPLLLRTMCSPATQPTKKAPPIRAGQSTRRFVLPRQLGNTGIISPRGLSQFRKADNLHFSSLKIRADFRLSHPKMHWGNRCTKLGHSSSPFGQVSSVAYRECARAAQPWGAYNDQTCYRHCSIFLHVCFCHWYRDSCRKLAHLVASFRMGRCGPLRRRDRAGAKTFHDQAP